MTDRDPNLDRWLRTLRTFILPRPTTLTPEQQRERERGQEQLLQDLDQLRAKHGLAPD